MRTVQLKSDVDLKKRVFLCIFWALRKTANTEGCAPFYIKKIATSSTMYNHKAKNLLKLSDNILSEIEKDFNMGKSVDFKISLGGETLNTSIGPETFSISAKKNQELEEEITDKLKSELKKKYPHLCHEFLPRVYRP